MQSSHPKESARAAIKALQSHGIAVKVVTGDNDSVARKICSEVGLPTQFVLLGSDVEAMDDDQLVSIRKALLSGWKLTKPVAARR